MTFFSTLNSKELEKLDEWLHTKNIIGRMCRTGLILFFLELEEIKLGKLTAV